MHHNGHPSFPKTSSRRARPTAVGATLLVATLALAWCGQPDGPGFTEVPGGIVLDQTENGDHGQEACTAPVTPADYEAADTLIADTVAAVEKYHHLDEARAAAYVQIAPPFGGEGAHYLNPAYLGDGQFINPERVESLVYRGDTLRLPEDRSWTLVCVGETPIDDFGVTADP